MDTWLWHPPALVASLLTRAVVLTAQVESQGRQQESKKAALPGGGRRVSLVFFVLAGAISRE